MARPPGDVSLRSVLVAPARRNVPAQAARSRVPSCGHTARSCVPNRAVAPVVGVTLLVFVVVALASVVAVGVLAVPTPAAAPQAALELSVDAGSNRIELTHLAGDPLDVEALRVTVRVDGEPLAHQPPVPFFAARGFRSGPTGPFNSAADPKWTPGETASVRLASTNAPTVAAGDRVRVDVYAATSNGGRRRIASLTATA